jgi:hypothetical protein
MSNRERIEGLMAASLYEPLSAEEEGELEAWFRAHPEDRAELEELRQFVAKVPVTVPEFTGDLRPVLREEIRRGAGAAWSWSILPRYVLQFAGVAAVTALLAVPLYQGMRMGFVGNPVEQLAALGQNDPLARADALLQGGDYGGAHALLSAELSRHPQAPQAGQWQQRLAQLEFDYFNRFPQAYAAYNTLRKQYGEVFAASPENAFRYDLLEQTRDADFEPLYIIASARENGMESFDELQEVVAKYTGRGNAVAELAIDAMKDVAGTLETPSDTFRLAGYEQLRRKCDNPVALAQLNQRLGQLYLHHLNDTAKARECLQQVAECADGPLADQALVTLASLSR